MIAKVTTRTESPFDDMFSIFPILSATKPNCYTISPEEAESVLIKPADDDDDCRCGCECKTHRDGGGNLNEEISVMFDYFDAGWNAALAEHKLLPGIKELIFSDPATIVFWEDGTKTVVKCDNEPFSEEHGLAMAYMRKLYPSRAAFKNEIAKGRHRVKKEKSAE